MAVWSYKGLDFAGKSVSGFQEADSPKLLRAALRRNGVVVLDVAEARPGKGATAGAGKGLSRDVELGRMFERVSAMDVANFTRQLATLLKAGIPLAEALGAMFDQISNQRFRTVVGEIRQNVNEGSALADAMSKQKGVFSDIYLSMVRAGETSGNLDQVLSRLADLMENQAKLKGKVMAALVYPVVMVFVGSIIMAVLMVTVVPKITQMFEDQDKALPWNTQLLILAADFMRGYWPVWLLGTPALLFFAFRWIRSAKGRPKWDRFILRIPLVGVLARQIAIARFARTLGTMLSSGVPLLRALEISKEILDNHVLAKVVTDAREEIQQGESIAATLKKSGEFPPLVTHMISVGERAGQLEGMLENVADSYEVQIDMRVGQLMSLLEPMMILVMGGAVTFIVFSILTPILQMNEFIK